MKKLLVTGGTVFVSRFVAEYFKAQYDVFVLNRNTKPQVEGVTLIEADRHDLRGILKRYHFDAVIDVCAYNGEDISDLLDGLNPVEDFIMISSSAVYPETNVQPFCEDQPVGANAIWGKYGTDKIEAEKCLSARMPNAYILRPPYLYGPMQNLYREPFIFDCAMQHRAFYLPKDGRMKLQFFYVGDLCRMIQAILEEHPEEHIFNVGNEDAVDIKTLVSVCYEVVGEPLVVEQVWEHDNQRDYFSFYDYEYVLDVSRQKKLLGETKNLKAGLRESFAWYQKHPNDAAKRGYIKFIDENFAKSKINH